jgi:predicted  nucleic acid-binding Zn-ribbon protein
MKRFHLVPMINISNIFLILEQITALTLKVSKLKATNQSTGVSAELEDLRSRFKTLQDEKFNLQKRFDDLQMKGQDDDEKRRKVNKFIVNMSRLET